MRIVINLYRLLDGYGKGDRTCSSQCIRAIGKECIERKNRKDFLEETKEHVQRMNKEKYIIIAGCYNQCIRGNETQKFYREI